jgi:hypothetical protein
VIVYYQGSSNRSSIDIIARPPVSETKASLPPAGDEELPEEPAEELQFDQAEFTTPATAGPACTVCKQPIAEEYYELGGKVICTRCRQGVEAAFRGGSRLSRAFKALVLGSIAAVIGALIYYAIIRMTGWNLGIVAVVIGLMVGGAVRKGSGNRGGRGYQFLALFLTYSAIALMLVPDVLEALPAAAKKRQAEETQKAAKALLEKVERDRAKTKAKGAEAAIGEAAKLQKGETAPSPGPPGADGTTVAAKDSEAEKAARDVAAEELPDLNRPPPSPPRFLMALVYVIVAYSSPVLMAIVAPISGLIFAFALWEAWKINRRLVLVFNGPFRLGTSDTGEPAPEVIDNES